MKRLTLLIFLLVSVIGKSQVTWTGLGSSNNWSDAANWSTDPAIPTAGSNVIFDGTSTKNCTFDQTVDANNFSINSGYTGIITAGAQQVNINGDFSQADGTFNGNTSQIAIGGGFSISGGTFNSTNVSVDITANIAMTGGTFNHNGGVINWATVGGISRSITGSLTFDSLVVIPGGASSSIRTLNFGTATMKYLVLLPGTRQYAFQGTPSITGELEINGSNTATNTANTATFQLSGTGPVTVTSNVSTNQVKLPSIQVNTSGNVTLTGIINLQGNWIGTQGNLISASSVVNMYGSGVSISGPVSQFNTLVLQSLSSVNTAASSSISATGSISCVGTLNPGASTTVEVGTNIVNSGAISSSSGLVMNVVGNYTCSGGLTTGASSTVSIGGILRNTSLITTGATSSLGVVGNFTSTAGLTLGANSILTAGASFTSGTTVSTGVGSTINVTGGYTYAAPINLGAGSTMTVGSTLTGTSAVTTGTGCTVTVGTAFTNNGGVNIGDGSILSTGATMTGNGSVTAGNTCTVNIAGNFSDSGVITIGDNTTFSISGTHQSGGAITSGNSSTITISGSFTGASSISLGSSCLFSTGSDLTASGTVLAGTGSTVDINGNYSCNGGLNLGAAADLQITLDFIRNNASLSATSTSSLTLDGTGTQNISATAAGNALTIGVLKLVGAGARSVNLTTAPLSIQNAVEVGNNVTYATNNNMTLKSTSALTARVGQLGTGASITGNVAKENVIPGTLTGWANLGVPGVTGQTFADWDTYSSSGGVNGIPMMCSGCTFTPGQSGNWFKSVQGWIEPTVEYDTTFTNGTSIVPGTGYWVYVGDGQTSTSDLLLLNTGSLVQGNVPVTLTSAGTGTNKGSMLLANPYASPISFSAFLLANGTATNGMVNGFSSWNADNNAYAVWNGSSGTNGATDVIAAGQGFYVVAGSSGNTLNFTESCKTTANTSANPLLRPSANPLAAKLRLVSPNKGEQDETVIALDNGASAGYDREHDMKKIKMSPGYPGYPGVYSDYMTIFTKDASGLEYAINTVPSDATATLVPVGVEVTTQGNYTISPIGVEMFASCLFLHDKQLNLYHDLKVKGDYAFTVSNISPANRFELILCANKSNGPVAITELVSNQNHVSISKDDNTIIVNTSFQEPTTATIEAYNILGQRIVAPLTVQGKENTVRIPADANSEIVIVKVTTDNGVYTKKVVMK